MADENDPTQSRIAALRAARDVAGADADLDEVKELASWILDEGEAPSLEDQDEGDEDAEDEGAEEPEEEEEEEEPEPPKKRATRSRKKS